MRSTGDTRRATGVGPPSCLAVRGNLRPLHIYTSDRTPPRSWWPEDIHEEVTFSGHITSSLTVPRELGRRRLAWRSPGVTPSARCGRRLAWDAACISPGPRAACVLARPCAGIAANWSCSLVGGVLGA